VLRVRLRTLELENTNHELAAEVDERRRSEARLAAEHAVTRALALAGSVEAVIPEILRAFISNMGAAAAFLWELSVDGHHITCRHVESAPKLSQTLESFVSESHKLSLPLGSGLPGEVWTKKMPVWVPNTIRGDNFPRARLAAAAGLYSAIGFPIKVSGEVCGVIEFFAMNPMEADRKLLEMLEAVGSEIGQFFQRKQIEQERENLLHREKLLREEAERANRMKDEFLATLSHELRTPLNSILGWSQIVLSDMVDAEGLKTALETIHRNATAQAQLIEELLEASRLITGKILLNLEPTEVAPIIEAAVDIVRPRAGAKGIEIVTSIDPRVTTVISDSTRLQQMVWNLLTNAIKFTSSGGEIRVETKLRDDTLDIIVRDTGMGISPEFLPFVFDRFRQQDSTSTRKHDGLGLGLAIVRHLAELHGGVVDAMSKGEGKGAEFTVSLPVVQGEGVATKTTETLDPSNGDHSQDNALEGVKIHVVDDDEDSCNLLKYAFGLKGATVETSNCATDAFERIVQQPPDVLLADINMPDEDGYSLIKKIRQNFEGDICGRFPAIALTAMAREEDSERALSAGFQLHVPKPVEIDELIESIRDLLSQAEAKNGTAAV
jgi:signal transduction histidine kinase/ActR/RegA family two-component response regulator